VEAEQTARFDQLDAASERTARKADPTDHPAVTDDPAVTDHPVTEETR
jgi:hypothetical protein